MKNLSNKLSLIIIFAFTLSDSMISASDEVPSKKQDHPIALIGATIHQVNGAVIQNGTILFENGMIMKLGINVNLPSGTEPINVAGKQ